MAQYFKTPPGIWHLLKQILDTRLGKSECLALCGRRMLVDDPVDNPTDSDMVCDKCQAAQ